MDAPTEGFRSLTVTDGEISLVCETAFLSKEVIAREDGWRAFRVAGPLDFSLVGILSPIVSILAEKSIPIFALSTYDTDYLLVKEGRFDEAANALSERYKII